MIINYVCENHYNKNKNNGSCSVDLLKAKEKKNNVTMHKKTTIYRCISIRC